MISRWGDAAEATQDRRATREKEKEEDILKYRKPTHNLM